MKINNISTNYSKQNFGMPVRKNYTDLRAEIIEWIKSPELSPTEKAEILLNYRILHMLTPNHEIYGTLGKNNISASIYFEPLDADQFKRGTLIQGKLPGGEINGKNHILREFTFCEENGNGRFSNWKICDPNKLLKKAISMIPYLEKDPNLNLPE